MGYRGNTFQICGQEGFVDHSLKTVVMDIITLPECSMVTAALAAWTVIITSMMATLNPSSVDVSPWQAV
jgi:hypothetical protein